MPALAILLGIVGLAPFIGCGMGAMARDGESDRMLVALVAYGAVVLAFLGGMQWGFALPAGTDVRRQRWRLVLGGLCSGTGSVRPLRLSVDALGTDGGRGGDADHCADGALAGGGNFDLSIPLSSRYFSGLGVVFMLC